VRFAYEQGRWIVFRYEVDRPISVDADDRVLAEFGWLLTRVAGQGRVQGGRSCSALTVVRTSG
jgi:hypothetical protein